MLRAPFCLLCRALFARFLFVVFALSVSVSGAPQMETLGRGVVAIRTSSTQVYVGWRMLGTDSDAIAFNLYRSIGGAAATKVNPSPFTLTTDFRDTPGTTALASTVSYFVRPIVGGVEQAASAAFTLPANAPTQPFLSIPLQIPPGGTTPSGEVFTYTANDASPADLDGDGEYELVLKWEPSNAKDNSQGGYTGNVLLDAYKLDGTRLWRIDLGRNIRAGAHYTQFMVYDLDGDGRAELACKTAPGTLDGLGNPVLMGTDSASADYRNSSGYILTGPEYLTIFNGLNGAQLATTAYLPGRGTVSSWGDSYGNRVDRFIAGVAYLDGDLPSLIMCRGYYTQTHLVAWDWRGGALTRRWTFSAPNNTSYAGQGNHQLSVADVDADGRQEIIYGAMVVNDDGTGLHTTQLGHSDALHVSDFLPSRPGLEVFTPQENAASNGNIGTSFRDARTGELLWTTYGNTDVGRACMMDIDPRYPGAEAWASNNGNIYSAYGHVIAAKPSNMFQNFGVWWDADAQRELLDGTTVSDWNVSTSGRSNILTASTFGAASNNGTKSTPALSGDLLGDWREEIVWRKSDNSALLVFTTTISATDRRRTFLADPQYRVALAWQNVAYNQPPHPSFDVAATPAFWAGPATATWDSASALWSRGSTGLAAATTLQSGDQAILRSSSPLAITLSGVLTPGSLIVDSAAEVSVSGPGTIASSGTFNKAGTGLLRWSANATFNTTANLFAGRLLLNAGSRLTAPRLTVFPGAAAGGPGGLTGTLELQAGASFLLRSSGPLAVTGGVTAPAAGIITVSAAPGETLAPGTYSIITYTGALSAVPTFAWSGPGLAAVFDTSVGGLIRVTLTQTSVVGPDILSWTGTGGAAWDFTALNWNGQGGVTAFEDGDTVRFDDTSSLRAITLNTSVAPASITFDTTQNWTLSGTGAITGNASLTKSGSGSVALGTPNTHTGGTRLNAGTLVLSHANGLGAGPVTLAGGTLDTGSLTLPNANALVIEGSGRVIGGNGGGTHGIKAVSGDGVLTLEATNVFDLEGSLANFLGRVVFTGTNSFRFFGGSGSAFASFDLGTRSLNARSGSAFALGSLEGAASAWLGGASGTGNNAVVTYTVGANGRDTVYAGTIANGNAATWLVKTGTGRLLLTGNSTYTGNTTVSSGRLIVTGALGASNVTVASGATFGGATGGSLTFAAGSRLALCLSPDGANGPVAAGAATINGLVTVVTEDLGGTLEPGTYDVLTYTGTLGGTPLWAWAAPAGSALVATFNTATPGLVRMTLADPRSAFELWGDDLFGASALPAVAGPLADPDGDGIPNLLEYALAGDPLAADGTITPAIGVASGSGALTLSFARVSDPSLVYEVEASDSLASPNWTVIWSSTGSANSGGPVVVEDVVAAGSRSMRFLRLNVR